MRVAAAILVALLFYNLPPGYAAEHVNAPANPTQKQSSKGPPAIEPQKDEPRENTAAKSAEDINRQLAKYTRYLAILTGLLVVATSLLAIPAVYQAYIARSTARRQLRAYVFVETATIGNVTNPLPPALQPPPGEVVQPPVGRITNPAVGPVAFLATKNTGQTPAYQVRTWAHICIREYPLVAGLLDPAPGPGPASVLGPGVMSTQIRVMPQPLTAQDIAHLNDGTAAIYVYGEITYDDAFQEHRFTRFRLSHNIGSGTLGHSQQLNFTEEGNNAN